ncbi:MAG: hypothetical protein A2W31_03320 [Planctomycetes bacterium RBG_16_64_10]|nr:MAG: hypothetical protein A2W31_03320 [Planctomycetes bacterium RBG_16_64_10]
MRTGVVGYRWGHVMAVVILRQYRVFSNNPPPAVFNASKLACVHVQDAFRASPFDGQGDCAILGNLG